MTYPHPDVPEPGDPSWPPRSLTEPAPEPEPPVMLEPDPARDARIAQTVVAAVTLAAAGMLALAGVLLSAVATDPGSDYQSRGMWLAAALLAVVCCGARLRAYTGPSGATTLLLTTWPADAGLRAIVAVTVVPLTLLAVWDVLVTGPYQARPSVAMLVVVAALVVQLLPAAAGGWARRRGPDHIKVRRDLLRGDAQWQQDDR